MSDPIYIGIIFIVCYFNFHLLIIRPTALGVKFSLASYVIRTFKLDPYNKGGLSAKSIRPLCRD